MYLSNALDYVKTKLEIDTDTDLARAADCTKNEVYRARTTGQCPTEILLKISNISGIELPALLMARELDSAKNQEVRAELERKFQGKLADILYYRKYALGVEIIADTCASIWNQTLALYQSGKNYANLTLLPGKTLSTTP